MDSKMRILRLVITVDHTSAPYHQFSLPLKSKHEITICSYFPTSIQPPDEIQLIEGNGSIMGFFNNLKRAFRQTSFDIVHVHYPHLGAPLLVAMNLWNTSRSASIYTVHSSYPNYRPKHRMMMLPILAFFRRIVFCSQSSYRSFPTLLRRLGGKRTRVVENGVDLHQIEETIIGIPDPCRPLGFSVLSVGRLINVKNPLEILAAFKENLCETSSLTFIGDGYLRDQLNTEIEKAELTTHAKLLGIIPRVAVYEKMARADLLISNSRVEGLPIAVLEAMACGCPVVLSDIPPHREIADGVDFIPLVPHNDISKLAREIVKYRIMSKSERIDIGQRCRQVVEDRFNLKRMVDGYEKIYAQASLN